MLLCTTSQSWQALACFSAASLAALNPEQIPKTSTEDDILAVFAPFGEVESVNILKSKGMHAGGRD
jgi:hypothetical protein